MEEEVKDNAGDAMFTDMEKISVPPHLRIIASNGEPMEMSLVIWIDYDNRWHAGYRNWTVDAALRDDAFIVSVGACRTLEEAIDDMKTKLEMGGFFDY